MYDDVDPASELEWMGSELQAAEDAGEKVYLISHHPPGHEDCTRTWSHQYNRIILRYSLPLTAVPPSPHILAANEAFPPSQHAFDPY